MRAAHLLVSLPLVVLPGCQMNERLSGTVGGAVGGGLLAAVVGASAGGVLATAAGGALAGYLVGDYLADQRERCGCAPQNPCGVPQGPCGVPAPSYESPCYVTPSARTQVLPAPAAPPPRSPALPAARTAYERGRSAVTAEEAVAAYEESLRLDPTRPEPWNALALHALVAGDTSVARERFEKALALDPTYAPAQHNLARLGSAAR
jgi:hypothetical protein